MVNITPELKQILYDIHNRLYANKKSLSFREPVDYVALAIPDYPKIITAPMDLSTIKSKLDGDTYLTLEEFKNDILLIFKNAMLYNSSKSPIYRSAVDLKKIFTNQYDKLNTYTKFEGYDEVLENLNEIMSTRNKEITWPFIEPVDIKVVKDYTKVIKEPMDLRTLKHNLEKGLYNNKEDFFRDLDLIITNCHTYNTKGDSIYILGSRLGTLVNKYYSRNVPTTEELIGSINELKKSIGEIGDEINREKEKLFILRKEESERFNMKMYTRDERIAIANEVSELDNENTKKVAKALKDFDSSINLNSEILEIDFMLLPDSVMSDIELLMERISTEE